MKQRIVKRGYGRIYSDDNVLLTPRDVFCMVTTVSNMFSAVFGESALTGCHNIGF